MVDWSTWWYRVKPLGEGTYGFVFLVLQENFNTPIVVKTIELENSNSVIKENKILSHFSSCLEIVKCYSHEITIDEGRQWCNLFLKYAPAGDLIDLIEIARGRMLESDVQVFTRMILKGLSCIHAKGIVHCDIKLENILVFPTKTGYQLEIADFKLAKEPSEALLETKKYRLRGTLTYMPSESVVLGKIGIAMDIYSLWDVLC
ncbi:mitogen-activated protein kinase kinase kinase 17-like [Morus notabilis]|uniref:mitogen-activated protein kinase kinase kinase 17-like n=1 Tax=Morus notabilis TaxID=981085 RepID=UPI000CED75A3|nr:mitogen-activated protein kinase kinase kinase 17-like [Morus notabilis]